MMREDIEITTNHADPEVRIGTIEAKFQRARAPRRLQLTRKRPLLSGEIGVLAR